MILHLTFVNSAMINRACYYRTGSQVLLLRLQSPGKSPCALELSHSYTALCLLGCFYGFIWYPRKPRKCFSLGKLRHRDSKGFVNTQNTSTLRRQGHLGTQAVCDLRPVPVCVTSLHPGAQQLLTLGLLANHMAGCERKERFPLLSWFLRKG